MFTIIGKQNLSASVRRLDIRAEALVAKCKPGHFVSVIVAAGARCIPMSVYEVDFRRRCLSLVFAMNDDDTARMGGLRINDTLFAVSGPFGQPLMVPKKNTIVVAAEDLGLVSVVALCRAFKQAGNKVLGVAGFATRKSSILENQMRLNCTQFSVMYGDGAHERRGGILTPLQKILAEQKPDAVYVHASALVTKEVGRLTQEQQMSYAFNIIDVLDAGGSFHENDPFFFNGNFFQPALEGVWVPGTGVNIDKFVKESNAFKEYMQCRRQEAEHLASKSVWARLKKFIWG